jgi:L-lactate dehydrogenase complex protein LldG
MSARDDVLASVRANLPGGTHDLPHVPTFDDDPDADRLARFEHWLGKMGGRLGRPGPDGDAFHCVRDLLWKSRVVCSTVPELTGNRDVSAVTDPHALADVDVAVVRASFGVAESGSVLLHEAALGLNALVYLAQHLVVLLDPADVVPNLHFAYRRPEFHAGHYAAFHTGPSATADIEGVLIHGAQGVRSLTVILLPKGRS